MEPVIPECEGAHRLPAPEGSLAENGVAGCKALAALSPAATDGGATPAIFHAGAKALLIDQLAGVGLESSLHNKILSIGA